MLRALGVLQLALGGKRGGDGASTGAVQSLQRYIAPVWCECLPGEVSARSVAGCDI